MEYSTIFHVRNLVENIISELTNLETENSTIIKVNSENLLQNGEVSFLSNLRVWRGYVSCHLNDDLEPKNILDHYLGSKNFDFKHLTDEEVGQETFKRLVSKSKEWSLQINSCSLKKERVCLFLNRPQILSLAIKTAVKNGHSYGKKALVNECFTLKMQVDKGSELTNQRLHFLKDVTENILRLQGYGVSEENGDHNYILTTKSEGIIEGNYKKIVCGVVKNLELNSKETSLTWKSYLCSKKEKLLELNAHKYKTENKEMGDYNEDIEEIARTVIKFELLSVKPSRAVFLKNVATSDDTMKGAAFILYNTARIKAILNKYTEKELDGNYPKLSNIEDVDFSCLNQEEEWELVYNFILQYPEMVQSCIKHKSSFEICPQYVSSFLSRLCQQFSAFYRRSRVLVEGYSHLMPTVMARIYMLQALLVVLENALAIFGTTSVTNM
ncbi:DALR anticodon-binding domain-containing protein 3 [Belonocnema kinseyi]|uniref:DALR anticodon-binding domain-containing protein 3 n=1 Tax=Belonocnema kinseyi TaxID=2817044 RepID=UPI00143DEE2D|nr:DALR anticodon-binding domain-containing protein 3 [Belonocnema kinseyi]